MFPCPNREIMVVYIYIYIYRERERKTESRYTQRVKEYNY